MDRALGLALLALLLASGGAAHALQADAMPLPWTQPLASGATGSGVTILQTLLARDGCCAHLNATGVYDNTTEDAVRQYQTELGLTATGVFGASTAAALLKEHTYDGYKDDGGPPPPGFLYKVHIPVHADRSIETTATLYAANMTVLHQFTVRTHGQDIPGTDEQRNQFTSAGVTPTGFATMDLNSPEDPPSSYGPYPVNRVVAGLAGNALLLQPHIRNGILMHTGEWPHWDPSQPMPNSHGCIHGHPDDIKEVWRLLVALGVVVRPNTGGALPYPYKPQGVVSIEQVTSSA